MQIEILDKIKKLPVEDQIALVEDIWNNIAEKNQSVNLSEKQIQILNDRYKQFKSNPSIGRNWIDIKNDYLNKKAV